MHKFTSVLADALLACYTKDFVQGFQEHERRRTAPPKNVLCVCKGLLFDCHTCFNSRIQPIPYIELKGVIDEHADIQLAFHVAGSGVYFNGKKSEV